MKEWLKSQWVKLATAVAGLLLLVSVYFFGRRRASGELDFAAAKRELELANAQSAKLQGKLEAVRQKQTAIVADILSEEIALSQTEKKNNELDENAVVDRLRDHGMVK